mmetsp:Transcript_20850/g.35346  ORF Transcript_20850/g.35346 Transcript_20850/m.35346 type:complete len:275 (+) Transcript_20850:401-1225(+)
MKIHSILSVLVRIARQGKRERKGNFVCRNDVSFVGNTNMTQDTLLLKGLEFFVIIMIASNGCSECQCGDLVWQELHGLMIHSFQLGDSEGKQVCQATAKTMSCNIQTEVLTSYVLVGLEFVIDAGKDTIKTLASVLITHLLIHQILREPRMRSWFASRNITFSLEERIIIQIEVTVREEICFAYATTKDHSNPLMCKIDSDSVDKSTITLGELVIIINNPEVVLHQYIQLFFQWKWLLFLCARFVEFPCTILEFKPLAILFEKLLDGREGNIIL